MDQIQEDHTIPAPGVQATGPDADANTVLELENMIKQNVSLMDRNKAEQKKLKEMLDSALLNDETYRTATEKAKEAAKEKSKAKMAIMELQATKAVAEKVKDLAAETKELSQAQSEYLREYARLSGSTEIEGEDGQVREIVYTAKLVKKGKR